ncbi:MAG: response regulator [Nitrospinota bacterium]
MNKPLILVVDDEKSFLAQMREILEDCGFLVKTAENGQEAVGLLEENPGFSVILTDERMPVMTGTEFAQKANLLAPLAVKIMITAYPEQKTLQDAINKGEVYRFLTKPIDIDEVIHSVNSALELYEKRYKSKQLSILFEKAKNRLIKLNSVLEATKAEKDMIKEKAGPLLTSQANKISELSKEIEKKEGIIENLKHKASEGSEYSKPIIDVSKYGNKIEELEVQKKSTLLIRDKLRKEFSTLLKNWESLGANAESDHSEISHQCREKLLEVRQCLLNAQLQ